MMTFLLVACSSPRAVRNDRVMPAPSEAQGPRISSSIPATTERVATNVLGEPLAPCSTAPMTGFRRTGRCNTDENDRGTHVVCAEVTAAFLTFTGARGNDLITPRPEANFSGLRPGDHWCLCALRYRESLEGGVAPPVDLAATHAHALDFLPATVFREHALPPKKLGPLKTAGSSGERAAF